MKKDRMCSNLRYIPKRGAVRIELVIVNPLDGAEGDKLGSWVFDDFQTPAKMKELGEEIHDIAQGQTDEDARTRKFKLIAYNADDEILPAFGFVQHPEGGDGIGLPDDEASAEGMVRQSIRHTERMFELTHKANERTMRVMADQIDVLSRRIMFLEKRETQVTELARSLYEHGEGAHEKELFYNRVDRSLGILAEDVLPAIGKELGILPENFKLGQDLNEYKGPQPTEEQIKEEKVSDDRPDTVEG